MFHRVAGKTFRSGRRSSVRNFYRRLPPCKCSLLHRQGRGNGKNSEKREYTSSSEQQGSGKSAKRGGFGVGKLLLWTGATGGFLYVAAQAVVNWGEDIGIDEQTIQQVQDSLDTTHHYARIAESHTRILWNKASDLVSSRISNEPTSPPQSQAAPEPLVDRFVKHVEPVPAHSEEPSSVPIVAEPTKTDENVVEEVETDADPVSDVAVIADEPAIVVEAPVATENDAAAIVVLASLQSPVVDEEPAPVPEPAVVDEEPAAVSEPAVIEQPEETKTPEGLEIVAIPEAPASIVVVESTASIEQIQQLQSEYAQLRGQLEGLTSSMDQQSTLEAARIQKVIAQYEAKFAQTLATIEADYQEERIQERTKFQEAVSNLSDEFDEVIQGLGKTLEERQEARLELVRSASKQVTELENIVKSHQDKLASQGKYVNVAKSLLMLQQRLVDYPTLPFEEQLAALVKASTGVPIVESVVRAIPTSAASSGLVSVDQLRSEFDSVARKARVASIASENRTEYGKVVDELYALVREIFTPEREKSEMLPGKSNLARMSRAKYFLNKGQLEPALNELAQLEGEPKEVVKGFVEKAHNNLIVQQKLHLVTVQTANLLSQVSK